MNPYSELPPTPTRRNDLGNDTTRWRIGRWGITCPTKYVERSAMRGAAHAGQNPRSLQLNATSCSTRQCEHLARTKPCSNRPQQRYTSNSARTSPGSALPCSPK
jgi:hypothetical protein